MSKSPQECTYQDLIDASNKDSPVEVEGECVVVTVNNMRKGVYYVAPFYFWSQHNRPLNVSIIKPGTKNTIALTKNFKIGRNLSGSKDQWTIKKYVLDKRRHNGKATFIIGWSNKEKVEAKGPFKLVAAPLTSKELKKQLRVDSGLCPTCGLPGQWQAMGMVCLTHGVFIGGL